VGRRNWQGDNAAIYLTTSLSVDLALILT